MTDVEFTCPDNRGSRLPPSLPPPIAVSNGSARSPGQKGGGGWDRTFRIPKFWDKSGSDVSCPRFPSHLHPTSDFFQFKFHPFLSPFFVSNDKHCVSRRVTESQPVPPVVGCIRALEGSHDGSINGGVGG